ncbi:hypothetical protein HN903_04195 [archaeon]|jgi:hypothetical protein|nr:hypothetical protein [archaeon]MBT7128931.1 hypothetical protein [archaeon]
MKRQKAILKDTQKYVNGMVEAGVETPRDLITYTESYFAKNPEVIIGRKLAAVLSDEHKETRNNNLSDMILNSGAVFNSGIYWHYTNPNVEKDWIVPED